MAIAHHAESRRGRLRAVESFAGWVFADMLLVLFLVGIGSAIPQDPPPPPPKVEPKPKPKPPEIIGMETVPVKKSFQINAAGLTSGAKPAQAATCSALKKVFSPQIGRGDRAAFVLIFAGGSDPGVAVRVAERVSPELTCASRKVFPPVTVKRTYWDGQIGPDDARVEVFFYTTKKAG